MSFTFRHYWATYEYDIMWWMVVRWVGSQDQTQHRTTTTSASHGFTIAEHIHSS